MEEFEKDLKEAVKHLQIADHMCYVTYPLVNENRLLLKIFDEIYGSIIKCVDSILNYEYVFKRDESVNGHSQFDTFVDLAKDYDLSNEQIKRIREIIELNKTHKQSAMEFVKSDKVVIMSDNLNTQILDILVIKRYLLLAKELLMKVNNKVRG